MAWRRLLSCIEQWPECHEGEYNPACCRFPKSCSCLADDEDVADHLLEPVRAEPDRESGVMVEPCEGFDGAGPLGGVEGGWTCYRRIGRIVQWHWHAPPLSVLLPPLLIDGESSQSLDP